MKIHGKTNSAIYYHIFDPVIHSIDGAKYSIVNNISPSTAPPISIMKAVKQLLSPIGFPSKLGQTWGGVEYFLITWSSKPRMKMNASSSKNKKFGRTFFPHLIYVIVEGSKKGGIFLKSISIRFEIPFDRYVQYLTIRIFFVRSERQGNLIWY